MPVLDILEYPDTRLTLRSVPVEAFDERLARLAADLVDTLHAHRSIGLCAPQVDVRQQVLVMDHSADQSEPRVYVNPVVVAKRGWGLAEERCLSVPDLATLVLRASQVSVRALDVSGEAFEETLSGMPAVCLQHEMDHFDGRLLSDRVNWLRRRRLRTRVSRRAAARAAADRVHASASSSR